MSLFAASATSAIKAEKDAVFRVEREATRGDAANEAARRETVITANPLHLNYFL